MLFSHIKFTQIVLILLILISIFFLLRTSFIVQVQERKIRILLVQMTQKQRDIQIYKTKLAYLKNPKRIAKLTHQYLPGLIEITKAQHVSWNQIPMKSETSLTQPVNEKKYAKKN